MPHCGLVEAPASHRLRRQSRRHHRFSRREAGASDDPTPRRCNYAGRVLTAVTALRVVNALVLVVAPWALWVRRDRQFPLGRTDHRRHRLVRVRRGPGFALAQRRGRLLPTDRKFYLLNCTGHVSYLLGATRASRR